MSTENPHFLEQPTILLRLPKRPEILSGPFTMQELYNSYLTDSSEVADKINGFLTKVKTKYNPPHQLYIESALKIATVAYQFNHHENKRFRKEKDQQTQQPIPTLYHSLEMAECLVDEGPGMNWVMVAAILLHDVPEDVKLILVENGQEQVVEKQSWFAILKREFQDTNQSALLIDFITGVTEKELPERRSDEGRAERERLKNTQIFKMIYNYVWQSLPDKKKRKDLYTYEIEAIYEVVYNLEHLFNVALQSAEHLQILLIKIIDIWHNLQSPEWIPTTKILRGRIAASLAEWFGWYAIRSDLILMMASVADMVMPFAPTIQDKYFLSPINNNQITNLTDVINIAKSFLQSDGVRGQPTWKLTEDKYQEFSGWPIVHTDDKQIRWQETTLPAPEVIIQVTPSIYEDIKSHLSGYLARSIPTINTKRGFSYAHGYLLDTDSCRLTNSMGRRRTDYQIKMGNGPSFKLRIETDDPYIIDVFKNGATAALKDVAEARGLFDTKLRETKVWDNHLASLIGFLYEPNLAISRGSSVMIICYQGSYYFLPGNITFKQLQTYLGLETCPSIVYDEYSLAGSFFINPDMEISRYGHKHARRRKTFFGRVLHI